MHRPTAETLGRGWRTTAILVGLVLTLSLGGLAGHAALGTPGAPTHVGPAPSAARTLAAAHPAGAGAGNASAVVNITTVWSSPQDIPTSFAVSVNLTGATYTDANVSISVAIWGGSPLVLVANITKPAGSVGYGWQDPITKQLYSQANYTFLVDYAALTSANFGGGTLPTGSYSFIVWATVNNTTNPNATANTFQSNTLTGTLNILNVPVVITNAPSSPFVPFPFWFNFTAKIQGTSGIVYNASDVTIGVEADFLQGTCTFFVPPQKCYAWAPVIIQNSTEPLVAAGNYSIMIDKAFLQPNNFLTGQYPEGQWQFTAWMTVSDPSNPGIAGRVGALSEQIYPSITTVNCQILGPAPNAVLSPGNETVSVQYSGTGVTGANITIWSGTNLVYAQGVQTPGPGTHGGGVTWFESVPGTYQLVLTVTSETGTAIAQEWVNVTQAAGGATSTVYYNTTVYSNSSTTGGTVSLISGLSNGAAGALLLVVGLIVGMVVAMMLGMMMWGGSKGGPAQPWSAKPASGAAMECSVCHQSFATEAELKEHQKSAHGMS